MALPNNTTISLSQVNTELGYGSTSTISLNDGAVRTLFGKSSGTISMSDGWGKSNYVSIPVYFPAGNIGGDNGTSYMNVSWSAQTISVGTPIYFYINAYATDGNYIQWTDPYHRSWVGASGNYTVDNSGNNYWYNQSNTTSFSGTFSITPNSSGYFSWGIRIYNPVAIVENHAVPIDITL